MNQKEEKKSKPKKIPIITFNDETLLDIEYEYLEPEKEKPKILYTHIED